MATLSTLTIKLADFGLAPLAAVAEITPSHVVMDGDTVLAQGLTQVDVTTGTATVQLASTGQGTPADWWYTVTITGRAGRFGRQQPTRTLLTKTFRLPAGSHSLAQIPSLAPPPPGRPVATSPDARVSRIYVAGASIPGGQQPGDLILSLAPALPPNGPDAYASLWGWYDATQTAAGHDLAILPDVSGQSRNMTLSNGATAAVRATNAIGGKVAWTFASTRYQLNANPQVAAGPATIATVLRMDAKVAQYLVWESTGTPMRVRYEPDPDRIILERGGSSIAAPISWGSGSRPISIVAVTGSGGSTLWVDGVKAAAGSLPLTTFGTFLVGSTTSGGGQTFNGRMGEAALFTQALTDAQAANLGAYHRQKWGI